MDDLLTFKEPWNDPFLTPHAFVYELHEWILEDNLRHLHEARLTMDEDSLNVDGPFESRILVKDKNSRPSGYESSFVSLEVKTCKDDFHFLVEVCYSRRHTTHFVKDYCLSISPLKEDRHTDSGEYSRATKREQIKIFYKSNIIYFAKGSGEKSFIFPDQPNPVKPVYADFFVNHYRDFQSFDPTDAQRREFFQYV